MAERRDDPGFTLIETIVVVVLMGLIAATLAAVFTVIVRTSPATEDRADDSRSLLSLTNWLSQDVTSTSVYGFEPITDVAYTSRCDRTGLPASDPILQLRWTEAGTTYVVDYRWEGDGAGEGRVVRLSCREGLPADRLLVTGVLQEVAASASNNLAPIPVRLDVNYGEFTTEESLPGTTSVQFDVVVLDDNGVQRELLSMNATTENVVTTLPPSSGGPSSSNQAPVASPGSTTATEGVATSYTLPASDPDPGDSLTVFFTNIPVGGWLVTNPSGVDAEITPPVGASGLYTMNYTVTDLSGATATNTLEVTVGAGSTNLPPIAQSVSTIATKGVPVTVSLPASDPEGSTLTAVVSGVPPGWSTPVVSGLDVTVTPDATAAGSYAMTYTVTDDQGASSSSTLTVNVCDASIDRVNPSNVRVNADGSLRREVRVDITSNGFCPPLVLGFLVKASDTVEETEEFNAGTSVTIGVTEYVWDVPTSSINKQLNLREGALGPIVDTATLQMRD